jgi:hypothetical protein
LPRPTHAEFFLAQIVSYYDAASVERFVETTRAAATMPGVRRVFLSIRDNLQTLALEEFPACTAEGLAREFGAGASAEDVCANTIRTLTNAGAKPVLSAICRSAAHNRCLARC